MRRTLLQIAASLGLLVTAGCDTDFATLVTDTAATLNLTLTAGDDAACGAGSPRTCTWFWQYSTNEAALSRPGQLACSGTCTGVTKTPRINTDVKQRVVGLVPNTKYHFQVCGRRGPADPDLCFSIKHFTTGFHARVDPTNQTRFVSETGSEFYAVGYNQDLGDVPAAEKSFDDPGMPVLKQRLSEIKNHGATTVRLMVPEVTHAMSGVSTFNKPRMDAFTGVMSHAESIGLKVVLTGLWDYNQNADNWYEALNETDRWNAQANYWKEFARRLAGNSAVFSYNLINEANVPRLTPVSSWRQGPFGYWLTKQPPVAPDNSTEVARRWIRKITAAIRQFDSLHMITMGGAWPSPIPYSMQAQELSYLSPHIYSRAPAENQAAIDQLRAVKSWGKPIVSDEISGMTVLNNATLEWLLLGAADRTNGALLTSCHEESCFSPANCPPGPDQFTCQVIASLWLDGARKFKNLIPILKRTAPTRGSLRHYNGASGVHPKICGMLNEVPAGYTFAANTASVRLFADSTAKAILRFAHTDTRNKYTLDSAPATVTGYASSNFNFERVAGFVYPTQVAGTSAIRAYVNAAGNEYLTAAPNEAALAFAGYTFDRILGYGWLP
ncbi:MAG TPA: hypothetical protein VI072_35280 [Polyangiaceae bacterium]